MIARGASLRSIVGRRVKFNGEYGDGKTNCVELLKVDRPGITEGNTYTLNTLTTLTVDRLITGWIEYNPILYKNGTLTGPTMVTSSLQDAPVTFRFEADVDMDLDELDYILKIYFESM